MTTPGAVTWQSILEKQAPQTLKQITGLREAVLAEGALSVKTKTLMMMLCDALLGHGDGVANIAKRARTLGATDAVIAGKNSRIIGRSFTGSYHPNAYHPL